MSRIPVAFGSIAVSALALCACDVEPAIDDHSRPIIGGTLHEGSPAVVMTLTSTGQCTGTLIGERTVLTAGHCVENDVNNDLNSGTVFFGRSTGDWDFQRRVNQIEMHRYYTGFANYDIAMLRLAEDRPAEIDPLPFNLDPLGDVVGETARVVGFGVSDGEAQTGGGVKRQLFVTISSVGSQHIGYGDSLKNICQGDSGGPTFLDFDGEERVVAVGSYGADFCRAESKVARVDAFANAFVIPTFDAWEGPCAYDGECDPEFECPRTPDPDCDPCQLDGFCASGCPKIDLDCPVGGFAGDLCESDDDCESRTCVEAPDDPRVSYCTQSCDPAVAGADQCAVPLSVCGESGGANVCQFEGPTPSTQGATCSDGAECRSGMCDSKFGICVEPCDGDDACGDEFTCEKVGGQRVCTLPRGGGGCLSVGGAGAGGGGLALIGLALAFAVRRRRR